MSGRRRRDDGYGGDRRDARDDRREPRADSTRPVTPGDRGRSADGPQPGYGAAAPAAAGYEGGRYNGDSPRRGTPDGYGNGNGTQGAGGYPGNGYRDGYGRSGYGAADYNAASRNSRYGAESPASGHARNGYGADFGGSAYGFEPTTVNIDDAASSDGPAAAHRPIGRLSIYTLHDDKIAEFDRIAERAAEGVKTSEPDTLVYVVHVVPKAPMQRIIYEIYRDRTAFESHEQQPHIKQFATDRAPCVLATNVIDLRMKYAKVTALGSAPAEAAGAGAGLGAAAAGTGTRSQADWSPRALESVTPVASFTPAEDQYAANGQYAPAARSQYSQPSQYGNPANTAFGSDNGQYGTANSYPAAADGYPNGAQSGAKSYPESNGYSGANGYSSPNGYTGANGYQSANGYSGTNGYSNANGYSGTVANADGNANGNGYANANGYASGSGYPDSGRYRGTDVYQGGGYANGAGNGSAPGPATGSVPGSGYPNDASGYGAAGGYAERAAGSYGGQIEGRRYQELPGGADSGGYADGRRYPDDRDQRYGAS